MTRATIRRCPRTPAVLTLTGDAAAALLGQDVDVQVGDGRPGVFAVVVDDDPVVVGRLGALPGADEVVAAVAAAGAVGLAV